MSVKPYLIVFGVTAGTAFLATPLVRRLSILLGAIDRPSDRKVHPKPTPTLGGIAIFVALVAGWYVSQHLHFFDRMYRISSEPFAALVAGGAIMAIGVVDDVRGTSVPVKVSGQLLASGLLVLLGVQLLFFWLPGQGILSLGPDLAVPFSILWIVAMLNAVNLVDGLDGLAAGLVAVASLTFFAYLFLGPQSPFYIGTGTPAALLSAMAAGAALGFLPWNFHPARIFMGDSGAMLFGMLLAAATISGVGRTPYGPTGGDLAAYSIPVLLPLVVLAVPFADVLLAILRRVRRGRRITAPDKEHIHHRLLDFGHSHRQAVLLMYLWSILISGTALAVALIDGRMLIGGIAVGSAVVILATAFPRIWWSRTRQARRAEKLAREEAKGLPESRKGSSRKEPAAAVGPAPLGADPQPPL